MPAILDKILPPDPDQRAPGGQDTPGDHYFRGHEEPCRAIEINTHAALCDMRNGSIAYASLGSTVRT